MNKLIAVTIGDTNGIGIDILFNLYKKKYLKNVVLFCDYKIIKKYIKNNKINVELNIFNKSNNKFFYKDNCLNIYSYESKSDVSNLKS